MHLSEMIFWPLGAISFIIAIIFMTNIFREGNQIADTMSAQTNEKTLVYQNTSDLSASGYSTRKILIDGSSIASDVIATADDVIVAINNSAGLSDTLSEDERKILRNKGNTTPILNRINVSRKYTKTYYYNDKGSLIKVEYTMD